MTKRKMFFILSAALLILISATALIAKSCFPADRTYEITEDNPDFEAVGGVAKRYLQGRTFKAIDVDSITYDSKEKVYSVYLSDANKDAGGKDGTNNSAEDIDDDDSVYVVKLGKLDDGWKIIDTGL